MPFSFGSAKGALIRKNENASAPLIIEIDTTKSTGTTYDLNFFTMMPAEGSTTRVGSAPFTPNFTIDWGDGTVQNFTTTGIKSRTYATAGVYTIKISGRVQGIGFSSGGSSVPGTSTIRQKLTKIVSWGNITGLQSLAGFATQSSLTSIPSDIPRSIVNLAYFFYNATTFNLPAVSSWNTSNVTNMTGMFQSASAFNQNLGAWNVSKVTGFGGMFQSAVAFNNGGSSDINNWILNSSASASINCQSMFNGATAFNQPIGSWNVSRVTNMISMFQAASSFNQNIGSWNTAAVTNMSSMFQNAKAFNQPIGSWNTANVTTMTNMFQVTTPGNSAFNQDIGAWNVSKVTTFTNMFQGISAGKTVFNNGGSDSIKNWSINTTAGVNVSMNQMFMHNNAFNQPIGSWNTSRVQNLGAIFSYGVFNQNIGGWNTSNCTNLDAMFSSNTVYNNGGVDSITWDTSLVGSFGYMFSGATSFNQPIPGFKFNSATNLGSMLNSCGMSNDNYSKTLIGWANNISSTGLGKNLSLGASGQKYSDTVHSGSPYNSGEGARQYLVMSAGAAGAGWTISGDAFEAVIPAGSTGFLVDYASPKFAYSLRNLYSSYTGNVVRVRRSSDNVESDFSSTQVSDGTLATWVGSGNDGFVTKWYDQSTNRNHLSQASTTNQPKIVSAGTLITDGSNPAVEFASDGNSWMQTATRITDARSVFMAASSDYTGTDLMFILGDTVSNYDYHAGNTSLFDSNYVAANVTFGLNKLNNVQTNFSVSSDPNGNRTALGRVLLSMIHAGSNIVVNSLSKDRANDGRSWRGKVQELVVYNTDQSANSSGIHSNINTYYSIY